MDGVVFNSTLYAAGGPVAISGNGERIAVGGKSSLSLYHLQNNDETGYERKWLIKDDLSDQRFYSMKDQSVQLSLNGKYLVVGNQYDDDIRGDLFNAGSVSVFRLNDQNNNTNDSNNNGFTWIQVGDTLFGPKRNALFGCSVGITEEGDKIAVGGRYYQTKVFEWSVSEEQQLQQQWNLRCNIVRNDVSSFGRSVALSSDGTRMIVGAQLHETNDNYNSGSAHIYNVTSPDCSLMQSINGTDHNQQFGFVVSMSSDGSRVAVGAPGYGEGSYAQVFVLDPSAAAYTVLGEPITYRSGTYFGSALSLSANGNRLAVGVPYGDSIIKGVALLYDIDEDGWNLIGTIKPVEDRSFGNRFGSSVALSRDGRRVIIGAKPDTKVGQESGQAQIFQSTW